MIVCAHPAPIRGAFRDRHGRWKRGAVDAGGAADERARSGRPSRVVLIPRRWNQVRKMIAGDGG